MSDVEDDPFVTNQEEEEEEEPAVAVDDDQDAEDDAPPPRRGRDEDDDDEEDEEEEEEEEDGGAGRAKKRRRRKANAGVSRFIDVEAEVDEDEEDEDDDDDFGGEGFIADPGVEGEDDDLRRVSASHFRRDREMEERPEDLTRIAEDYAKRYKQSAPSRYTGDMNDVPQRLLMPSVHDANLWQVRVKQGKERELVLSLMRKSIDLEFSPRPLEILSVFQRDSLPGMIYVEARSSKQVTQACQGLVGVYASRGVTLVPIEEMAPLLLIKKQDVNLTPGSWVRIRRGKYGGDLAQVMDITENGEEVGLKFIPRIDLNPREDPIGPDGKKRKKTLGLTTAGTRPPQRFFNFEEVAKVYKRQSVTNRGGVYVFQNDTYREGFIEKDFRITAIELENPNPTLDEITMFSRGQEGGDSENPIDLSIIAEASRKAAIAVLQPGDHVEVFEGEQSGVQGMVHSVAQDIVTITASGVELDGQRIDVPARSVRKKFKAGDHVKVMTGKNADETGLVVAVSDNIVTFLSDLSLQEVSVFSKDLREAAEVGASTNTVGNYELHDLVQLDAQNVGVIFKTERDSFRVLDQNGQVRVVRPHQISMRRDSVRALATDSEGHEIRVGDALKEVDGESRKGRVLHLFQSFYAFLRNQDIVENGGVFVTRCRALASQIPKGKVGVDSTKMNPAMAGGAGGPPGVVNITRGPRDRYQGLEIKIVKGAHKGHIGIIKDTNAGTARVEVSSKNKIITMPLDALKGRMKDGSLTSLEEMAGMKNGGPRGGFSSMGPPNPAFSRTPNPYQNGGGGGGGGGGATPGWGMGRTPNPYANGGGKTPAWGADSSRTPAWNASSRTPNPYAAANGGKTPAWDASARTPNPYASGKTPAWDASARTPNPYAAGGAAGGWATPNPRAATGAWNASPARPSGAWGAEQSWNNASSNEPWATAPTPGMSAPTPAAFAATPGAGLSAPTPGASGAYGEDGPDEDLILLDPLWLVKINVPNKAGLIVRLKGTTEKNAANPNGFVSGQYEGQVGCVKTAAANTLSSGGSTTVLLESNEDIFPPPRYLVPVEPESSADRAVWLVGQYAGQVLKMVSKEDSDNWVAMLEGGAYEMVPTSQMCKFVPPDVWAAEHA